MSSVASPRALLLALGGASIVALFYWYLESKKSIKDEERRRVKKEVVAAPKESSPVTSPVVKKESTENQNIQNTEEPMVQKEMKKEEQACPEVTKESASSAQCMTSAVSMEPSSEQENEPPSKTVEPEQQTVQEEKKEEVKREEKKEEVKREEKKEEKKEEKVVVPQQQSTPVAVESGEADSQHAASSTGEPSLSEGETSDCGEQVSCEKSSELMLDCCPATVPQEPFSWSEEMERSTLENQAHGDHEADVYQHRESPGMISQNSEASSQDSGRATGGLASSLSPMDESSDGLPMYEFEIPNSLVGLIIGVKGKTIKELSIRTEVRMLIRQHHLPEKANTHQICQVRGKRDQINRCLQMLRRRFPPARFPELNLQPVIPPPLPNNLFDALSAQPSWLSLPDNIPCEVACSSLIDPGHFFLQQPTHPSYPSLSHLDMYMWQLYTQGNSIPELPKPTQSGLLCAAPVLGAWFRAVTVTYLEENDEVLVRFVDYGGYTKVPRADLRQIRTDLMSLPFQATECYLAHVQPIDGTWQWGEEAHKFFQKLCTGKVMNATVVGQHVEDKVPMVELTTEDENGKVLRLDRALMAAGFAKASDPSKMVKAGESKTVSDAKRASLVSQTSQVVA